MENIDISIIVPIYNIAEYIYDCVRPLLEDTFLNNEIILVNDGSTDNSINVINDIAKNNKNIKIINKENSGLSSARNTGIKAAKGKYLFFLDGDDFISIKCLEKMYSFAEDSNLEITIGNGRYYFGENNKKNNYFVQGKKMELLKGIKTGEEVLEYMIEKNCYKMEVWDKLYLRKLIIENDLMFEEGLLHEDELFTPNVFSCAKYVSYFGNIKYNYRQRNGSINQTVRLKNCLDYISIADRFYQQCYKDNSIGKFFVKRIMQQYLRAMQLSLSLNKIEYIEFESRLENSKMKLINEKLGLSISARVLLFKHFKGLYKLLYLNYRKARFMIVGKV